MTREQIEAANKAREAALQKDDDFRRFEEQRFQAAAKAREAAMQKEREVAPAPNEESPS